MNIPEEGYLLRIFIGESDRHGRRPLYEEIVLKAREAGLAGATVLVNLSASNITVGKAAYRHALVSMQSARCLAAYLYSSAGGGESTTDLAWDGQSLICENGELLRESERFSTESHLISADVDLQRLAHDGHL